MPPHFMTRNRLLLHQVIPTVKFCMYQFSMYVKYSIQTDTQSFTFFLMATLCIKPPVFLEADNQGKSLKITAYLEPSLTLPPACPLTAKQKRVDSSAFPSILNCAKLAACPSIGCDTFLSTEYSCIAPTTRFC